MQKYAFFFLFILLGTSISGCVAHMGYQWEWNSDASSYRYYVPPREYLYANGRLIFSGTPEEVERFMRMHDIHPARRVAH